MTIIFVTFYGNGYGIIVPWGEDGACPSLEKKLRDTSQSIYIT